MATIRRQISIGDMVRSRKRSFEEEADRLHEKCLKVSAESLAILKAYPNGKIPLVAWKRFNELLVEQGEYIRMHIFFREELEKMVVF